MAQQSSRKDRRITKRHLGERPPPKGVRDSQRLVALAPLLEDVAGRLGVGLSIKEGTEGESQELYVSDEYTRLLQTSSPLHEDTIALKFDETEVQLRLLAPDDRDEKLDQLAKMALVGEVSVGLAHDFRNVLTAILGNLELFGGDMDEGRALPYSRRTSKELITEIRIAAEMGLSLCGRIEDLGSTKRKPRTENLVSMVESAIALLKNRLKQSAFMGRPIAIHNRVTETMLVNVISSEVQMAIMNILFNAFRYCGTNDKQGEITLDAYHTGGHYVLSIWNNGPPIPPKMQETLLKKPLASASVRGYGLYTAASNLRKFGCELTFTSDADGTLFQISFPKSTQLV